MDPKAWYLSKTLWANVLLLVLAVLDNAYFGGLVPPDVKVYIVGVVNLLLRFLTSQPLATKKPG